MFDDLGTFPEAQKILVCCGERHVMRLTEVNLRRQGYEVVTTQLGSSALELAFADPPDLLILDSSIPDMEAGTVIRAVRDHPATRRTKVILIATDDSPDDEDPPDLRILRPK